MCVPGPVANIVPAILSSALSVTNVIVQNNQQAKNNEYRAQVAVNNIRNAQNEAKRQTQLGIEKAREERLNGLKSASALLAKNASSNTDVYSGSNLYNYEDASKEYFQNALNIENSYNYKADKYIEKANNYLTNYNMESKLSKKSALKQNINSLGSFAKVASNWYVNSTGDINNYDFI
jgi:type II secretory pathway pseudopilin PulG